MKDVFGRTSHWYNLQGYGEITKRWISNAKKWIKLTDKQAKKLKAKRISFNKLLEATREDLHTWGLDYNKAGKDDLLKRIKVFKDHYLIDTLFKNAKVEKYVCTPCNHSIKCACGMCTTTMTVCPMCSVKVTGWTKSNLFFIELGPEETEDYDVTFTSSSLGLTIHRPGRSSYDLEGISIVEQSTNRAVEKGSLVIAIKICQDWIHCEGYSHHYILKIIRSIQVVQGKIRTPLTIRFRKPDSAE